MRIYPIIFIALLSGCASQSPAPEKAPWTLQKIEIKESTRTGDTRGQFSFPISQESVYEIARPSFEGSEKDLIGYLENFREVKLQPRDDTYEVVVPETNTNKQPSGWKISSLKGRDLTISVSARFYNLGFEKARIDEHNLANFNRVVAYGTYHLVYSQKSD